MKPRDVFRDLSNDHRILLQHASRLNHAAQVGRAAAHEASRSYIAYWARAVVYHLLEEERFVLPAAIDQALAGNIRLSNDKMRHQSDWLRVAVIEPSLLSDALRDLAGAIRHHVRLMEFELFDNMAEHMGTKRAAWIRSKSGAYRVLKRPDAMGDGRSEPTYL